MFDGGKPNQLHADNISLTLIFLFITQYESQFILIYLINTIIIYWSLMDLNNNRYKCPFRVLNLVSNYIICILLTIK